MITRKTIYKFYRRYFRDNILVLNEKLLYYNNRIVTTTNKLDITLDVLTRNKLEFQVIYDIALKNIDVEFSRINHINKVAIHNHISDFSNSVRAIDKSHGEHTVLLIKSLVDNYYEIQKEIRSINRQIQLINDKLDFFNRYNNLSEEAFKYIIAECNKYYEHLILNGETVHLGNNLGFIKIMLKSVNNKINWDESKKYRKQLLLNGKKPFNKEESLKAKANGQPYNAVEWYVMYENETQPYINWYSYSAKLPNKDVYTFSPTRFNLTSVKNSELKNIAKTTEEIIKLDIGIVNKLNMLMKTNEMQFLKYSGNDI